MTIDQLNKLTDEEVRERIANILFPQFPTYWHGKVLRHRYPSGDTGPAFNYPDDLNAAFTLVEKLRGEGHGVLIAVDETGCAVHVHLGQMPIAEYVCDSNPARAICLAFLAVTEREEG